MPAAAPILVCFATREEAAPFRRLAPTHVCVLLTGIGRRNAHQAVQDALTAGGRGRFDLVISAGFAGGLDPALPTGTIVFDAGAPGVFATELARLGARPAKFHCATRIAVTAHAKAALRQSTAADAVEMESAAIAEVCRERGIACVTVRVISDTADEDLPLDFNRLYTPDYRLRVGPLAAALLRSPARIPSLWRFRNQITHAAEQLAGLLASFTEHPGAAKPQPQ